MGISSNVAFGPVPAAYWLWSLILSVAVGAYVGGLILRRDGRKAQVTGAAVSAGVLFVLLALAGGLRVQGESLFGPRVLADWPVLSLVTFIPLVGAIIVLCLPRERYDQIRWTSLLVSLFPLGLSIALWAGLDATKTGFQFVEQARWIEAVGINYHLGVDGISVPMVFLTALLTSLAVLYSFIITDRPKEYFAFFLLLEMAMIGVFVALNFFLFYIFWELSLVPMYFLIGLWGAPPRQEGRIVRGGPYAAMKFFIYTLVGSVALLLAILAIYFRTGTFDIAELITRVAGGERIFQAGTVGAALAFWALFVGFAIKVPSFPFHTWLPDAHVEAPTAGSVILAGVLLKLGCYGLIRILLPLMPSEFNRFAPIIVILAMISIVYGALVAMAQWDLKKLIAYSSVNHMGYVVLGVAIAAMAGADLTSKAIALNGAVLQMFNHGIITGGLFFLVGVIYERVHTRDLHVYGGLRRLVPAYAGIWGVTCFASLGLPGLAGFVSEFMVFRGAFGAALEMTKKGVAVLLGSGTVLVLVAVSTLGIVFTAAFLLWTIQRMLFGMPKEKFEELYHEGHLFDMDTREIVTMAPLLAFMVAVGIYPAFIVDLINQAVTALLRPFGS
ncbi:MAG: complex I subunit 4 family protein [Chloroflexia bacterium]